MRQIVFFCYPILGLMRHDRHYTKMYVAHHNILLDSFRIRIAWF